MKSSVIESDKEKSTLSNINLIFFMQITQRNNVCLAFCGTKSTLGNRLDGRSRKGVLRGEAQADTIGIAKTERRRSAGEVEEVEEEQEKVEEGEEAPE